jgi:peptidoglycan/xylan/chitin deacetylase (PgdA/CDA1 family)
MTVPASSSGRCAVILVYHRVAELKPDASRLCIAPETFREHMAELRKHYHPMKLTELADALACNDLPAGAVAVTLDDGCIDNFMVGSEILQEFDVPATFFIPTGRLEERREFWWDALERVFLGAHQLPAGLELYENAGPAFPTESEEDKATAHRVLAETISSVNLEDRDVLMGRIAAWAKIDLTPRETHRPMLAEEVRELAQRRGHAIGAHSVHHLSLPALPPDLQRREMAESKTTLEHLLGTPVTAFAYPYGRFDDATLVRTADLFHVAVTATHGGAAPGDDPMALPRIAASRLSRSAFTSCLDSILAGTGTGSRPRPPAPAS